MNTTDQIKEQESEFSHEDSEQVRVMIVLEEEPAIALINESGEELAGNTEVSEYREELNETQQDIAEEISEEALDGEELDVEWNLTLVSNAISANVKYGQIEAIGQVEGVKAVYVEREYQPMSVADTNNIVAQDMTSVTEMKETGYTGAGTRVAVIDTGTDTDHQSFAADAYEYSLLQQYNKLSEAEKANMTFEKYVESLNLLTVDKIAAVLEDLNCYNREENLTAKDLYISSKLPFAYNYVDGGFDVTHDNDEQGEHGSHVAGIATANTYINSSVNDYDFSCDGSFNVADAQALLDYAVSGIAAEELKTGDLNADGSITAYDVQMLLEKLDMYEENDGDYDSAKDSVGVTGVAPDAQLITMKVFGANGGAYTSDYIAATEDAITLGCAVANLSLGSSYSGFTSALEETAKDGETDVTDYINGVMQDVSSSGMVMSVAAGNEGNWADNDDAYQHMYADEAGTSTHGEPSTFKNSLAVASVDNVGAVTTYTNTFKNSKEGEEYKEASILLEEVSGGVNKSWESLDPNGEGTEYEVVFLGNPTNLMNGKTQTLSNIYGGSTDDFKDYDYTGKIVMIARGDGVYFSDKHANAALAGAAAVIIYNNESGSLSASIEGSEAAIPCAGISLEQAQEIFALCNSYSWTEKQIKCKVTVKAGLHVDSGDGTGNMTMSDFSSWGTTGALDIKPEITAPGGGIYSVNGGLKETNGYETMSGTSMATPHISGLTALASQYVTEQDVLKKAQTASGIEKLTQRNLIQSLLMSTAEPITEQASGVEYSVRNQGSGLADISNVVKAESFIMVDGQEDGKVKAELHDGGKEGWTFSFSINNITENALTYNLKESVLTTKLETATDEDNTYALTSDLMEKLGAEVTYTGENVSDGVVTVAANSTTKVTVTIKVKEDEVNRKTTEGFTNGFYVEGYVYVEPQTTEEGVVGVTHSIPLLGWYGNWTDASMYDTGSYIDTIYDTAERPSHINDSVKNVLTCSLPGYDTGFYYTGNVYGGYNSNTDALVGDQRYIEARNALSTNENRAWDLYAIYPTVIRNVRDFQIVVSNAENDEVYYINDYEEYNDYMFGSFYYAAGQQWYDVTYDYGIGIGWDFTDAEGNPVAEGTRVKVSLVCAPEYYMTGKVEEEERDGETIKKDIVRWDDLGKGAYLDWEFTIDNTAPDLAKSVENPLSIENGELKFSVQDNNYIAAVILLNGAGTEAVEYYYPDMDAEAKGSVVSDSFDAINYIAKYGNKAKIAICDYAGNETYYAVNLNGEGTKYGELFGFQYDTSWTGGANTWVSFSEGVSKNETTVYTSDRAIVAAEYVSGYIFVQVKSGELYAIPYADMLKNEVNFEDTFVARLSYVYQDLAYNYATGTLYGLTVTEDGASIVNSIAIKDACQEEWVAGRGDVQGLCLACDDDGVFYLLGTGIDEETGEATNAQLWAAAPKEVYGATSYTFEMVGDTGYKMDCLQSMTWDHNNETLYWARFYPEGIMSQATELMTINPKKGSCTVVGTLSGETAGLMAPLNSKAAKKEVHKNVPEFDSTIAGTPILSSTNLSFSIGGSQKLTCNLEPWYTSYKKLTWTSSNDAVATVSQDGLVTAKGEGRCTITVTTNGSKTATCSVNVAALSLSIEGITSVTEGGLGSTDGCYMYKFLMNKGVADTSIGNAIGSEEYAEYGLDIAASTEAKGSIWACEYNNTGMIYEFDKETGEVKDMLSPIDGEHLYGMTYSEATGYFTGIMNYELFVDQPFTHEAEEDMLNSYDEATGEFTWHKIDMSEYLNKMAGNLSTNEDGYTSIVFCGITSMDNTTNKTYSVEMGGKDYTGTTTWGEAYYAPTTTFVLLDNVGRLWYIDEVTNMTLNYDYGVYSGENDTYISPEIEGVFTQGYDTDGDDIDDTCSVFVIREVKETPLYDMFLNGTMPAYTYHFSSLYYTEDETTGTPLFFMSLYDYFTAGAGDTSQLYLYVPGEEKAQDALYDLGTTGKGNIISTINSAEVTDGLNLGSSEDTGENEASETTATIYADWYME